MEHGPSSPEQEKLGHYGRLTSCLPRACARGSPGSSGTCRLALRNVIEGLLAGSRTAVAVEAARGLAADAVALAGGGAAVPVVPVLDGLGLVGEAAGCAAPLVRVGHEALAVVRPGRRGTRRLNARRASPWCFRSLPPCWHGGPRPCGGTQRKARQG